ncbi:hypothetical protein DYB28_004176 [Aphanomyces astaci]|uniref:PDZ domain-containing protein n=1 Tax=Aphanomyces astaci TaxID=112090 RepID=A0A397DEW1_APHAT|nr:hypothetical protein DYB36_009280 [Aphanomyces astaci]RHX98110.1 hypothetical protein DYB25_002865 [Aphanomyces astaci]RHY48554.1 hypothetical protein DYB34_008623 [Aphanomyces astaci]RHY60882.1 hypothetical protein DYB30_009172 [Aphanomyces astaci]RHY70210.1 hypothetical protein DYB38_007809 [Aphanomyces astaci]
MLSSYEQGRRANIARNKEMLESLGIDKSEKKVPVRRSRKKSLQPQRRSSRVGAVSDVRAKILQGMESLEEKYEREQRQLLRRIREDSKNERRELNQMRRAELEQRRMAKLIKAEQKRLAKEERAAAIVELRSLREEQLRLAKLDEERRRNVVKFKLPVGLRRLVATSRQWSTVANGDERSLNQATNSIQEEQNLDEHFKSNSSNSNSNALSSDDDDNLSSDSSIDEVSDEEFNELSGEDDESGGGDSDVSYRASRRPQAKSTSFSKDDTRAGPDRSQPWLAVSSKPKSTSRLLVKLNHSQPRPRMIYQRRAAPSSPATDSPPSSSSSGPLVVRFNRSPAASVPRKLIRPTASLPPDEPNAKRNRFLIPPKALPRDDHPCYQVHLGKGVHGLCIDLDVVDGKSVTVTGFRQPLPGVQGPAEACGQIEIGDELIAVDGDLIGGPAGFKRFVPVLKSGLSVTLRFRKPTR